MTTISPRVLLAAKMGEDQGVRALSLAGEARQAPEEYAQRLRCVEDEQDLAAFLPGQTGELVGEAALVRLGARASGPGSQQVVAVHDAGAGFSPP